MIVRQPHLRQALKYARAAAAVRACAVKLAVTPKGKLNVAVPYIGGALEAQIIDIIRTGTCVQLQQFRCGGNVHLATSLLPAGPFRRTAQAGRRLHLKYLLFPSRVLAVLKPRACSTGLALQKMTTTAHT